MGYRLAPAADIDLELIYDYGFDQFGQSVADRYLDELISCFRLLNENPEIARMRDEARPPVRAHPFKSHLIIYEIDDKRNILILRVRNAREGWLRDLDL